MGDARETLILRFRDLVTPAGQTVRDHAGKIGEKGFAWWGWWSRPHEKVPRELLLDLNRRVPLRIHLLDMATPEDELWLHSATADRFVATPTGVPIHSPDISATPDYYNNANYKLWIRLTSLDLSPSKMKRHLILLDVPTLVSKSEAEGFIDKPFANQKDLRQIDVTLWHVLLDGSA